MLAFVIGLVFLVVGLVQLAINKINNRELALSACPFRLCARLWRVYLNRWPTATDCLEIKQVHYRAKRNVLVGLGICLTAIVLLSLVDFYANTHYASTHRTVMPDMVSDMPDTPPDMLTPTSTASRQPNPVMSDMLSGTLEVPTSTTINAYYDLRVPAKIGDQDLFDGLMNGKTITIAGVNTCAQIKQMAKEDGWQMLGTPRVFDDGGSVSIDYFKANDKPAVTMFCRWDMGTGRYTSVALKFIHPASMGSWLLVIQNYMVLTNQDFSAAKMMGCDGVLVKTVGDSTKCVSSK